MDAKCFVSCRTKQISGCRSCPTFRLASAQFRDFALHFASASRAASVLSKLTKWIDLSRSRPFADAQPGHRPGQDVDDRVMAGPDIVNPTLSFAQRFRLIFSLHITHDSAFARLVILRNKQSRSLETGRLSTTNVNLGMRHPAPLPPASATFVSAREMQLRPYF